MARKLKKNVTMPLSEDGSVVGSKTYGPDYPDPLPAWAAKRLADMDVWDRPAEAEKEIKPLYEMRKAELVKVAKEMGVDSSGTMDEIKDRLEAAGYGA